MISIKKYLSAEDNQSGDSFERMAHLLLQAIGLHAVDGDQSDRTRFQSTISDLQNSLAEDPSAAHVLYTTGAAVKALEDYNRRSSHFIRAKCVELQSIVGMLTESMS